MKIHVLLAWLYVIVTDKRVHLFVALDAAHHMCLAALQIERRLNCGYL